MAHGPEPVRDHDLSRLRVLGSTGEPWNPEPWWWFFREVGRRPLPDRQLQRRDRGQRRHRQRQPADAHEARAVLRPSGRYGGRRRGTRRVSRSAAIVGELAIRAPMPGMTRGFWHDRERYLETYWARFPGRLGPRRLGPRRPRWPLVHPGPIRRHAQGRGQAGRSGRGRVSGRAPWRRCSRRLRSACRTTSRARPSSSSASSRPGETDSPELRSAIAARIAESMGKALKPERVVVVPRAAQDAQRQGHAPRRPCCLSRP